VADLERIEPKLTVAGRPACFGQTGGHVTSCPDALCDAHIQ